MEEMRIGEKSSEEKLPQAASSQAAGQLGSPFLSQHLDGSHPHLAVKHPESLAVGSFPHQPGNSAESSNQYQLGSKDSLGQGGEGTQAEITHTSWTSCASRDGEEQALSRMEGMKIRSKSLKCTKVNFFLVPSAAPQEKILGWNGRVFFLDPSGSLYILIKEKPHKLALLNIFV